MEKYSWMNMFGFIFRKQLYACSPEIRELERQLRRGYYAKTLYAQRLEGEAMKLEDKVSWQDLFLYSFFITWRSFHIDPQF